MTKEQIAIELMKLKNKYYKTNQEMLYDYLDILDKLEKNTNV